MTFNRRTLLALPVAAAMAVGLAMAPAKAADFPSDDMTMFVGFSAGGVSDVLARGVAKYMGEKLGVATSTVNKAGASGHVAIADVMNRRPDGHTVSHLSTGSYILAGMWSPKPTGWKDLAFLGQMSVNYSALFVSADSPYKTLQDLMDAMKANPGELKYGHSGTGNFHHVNAVAFLKASGLESPDVPFKGGAKSRAALLGGNVDYIWTGIGNITGFEDQMRVLAVAGDERHPVLNQYPTFKESGIDMDLVPSPHQIVTSGKVPADRIAKLRATMAEIAKDPEFIAEMEAAGIPVVYLPAETLEEQISNAVPKWQALIDEIRAGS